MVLKPKNLAAHEEDIPPEAFESIRSFAVYMTDFGRKLSVRNASRIANRSVRRLLVLIPTGFAVLYAADGVVAEAVGTALLTGGVLGWVQTRVQWRIEDAREINAKANDLALSGSDLTGADFRGWEYIRSPYFRGKTLDHARFSWLDFGPEVADFGYASLVRANFTKTVSRTGTWFADSDLTDATFLRAEMPDAKFMAAACHRTRFVQAELSGANFRGADLTGADFTGAVLTGARFTDAVVTGVKWDGAVLTDVIDLSR